MIRNAAWRRRMTAAAAGWLAVNLLSLATTAQESREKASPPAEQGNQKAVRKLFDGKTLDGWKLTNFGGEGEVYVEEGKIIMDMGFSLTGITSVHKDLPKSNYEIQLEASRLDGVDFFCALTFPVKQSHASLVVGGWAGAVVGISCIDDRDASANETTKYMGFKNQQWYRIRLRVQDRRLQAWIDDKQVVDVNIEDRKLSTRPEVELSQPLGVAAWETRAALRNITLRRLSEQELAAGK